MFAILVTLFDAHRCVIIFIFPPEDSKLLWYLARTRRNWGPRETDADRRHIAIGRDETREVACQGIAPHLHDRPFVGIGRSLRIFQAPRRSFFPLFFPPRAPHFPSFTPPPCLFPRSRTFVSICSTLRRIGALASLVCSPFLFSRVPLHHYYRHHSRFYFYLRSPYRHFYIARRHYRH